MPNNHARAASSQSLRGTDPAPPRDRERLADEVECRLRIQGAPGEEAEHLVGVPIEQRVVIEPHDRKCPQAPAL